jgi:photosystem I subunit PsaO
MPFLLFVIEFIHQFLTMALAARSASVRVAARRVAPASRRALIVKAQSGKPFDSNWLKTDPVVLGLGFAGWTLPSTIGVPSFGGESLFSLFTASISEELARFPAGPALGDKFWLYLITWHVGLFVTMTLGQIGAQGRKQGYW